MSQDNSVDAKLCRFFKFIETAVERYALPQMVVQGLGLDPQVMLKDKKARQQFLEVSLPMVVNSSQDNAERILAIRGFFEKMSPADRENMIENEFLPLMREFVQKANDALAFLESNKHQINSDMRTLGAYLTMFTESYLKQQ